MLHILASILSYDIWFYISHVILHTRSVYPIHKEHHTMTHPTVLDTYKGHFLEGPFQSLGVLVPFCMWSYGLTDILAILFLLNMRGMMRHDDRFTFLIGNHHLLHHRHPSYNFGEYWIDSLCGTVYPNKAEYVRGYIYL
jgi:sterol desaturase/sphingolipid hydroxylase (fatty acid hydroxylase superfamily)